jgi:hypothetical protein
VSGDARLCGGVGACAAGRGTGQFRPARQRLSECAGHIGGSADCALACERDKRCRAWSFNYPTDATNGAVCWLKSSVPARVQNTCCVSGVRGAGVVEPRNSAVETSIDRFGGDYRNFELKSDDSDDACKAACAADNKCRAWTYARPGYSGKEPHCFLKKEIKPPRRKAGFTSGVVR